MSEQCVGLLSPAAPWPVSLREVLILLSLLEMSSARKAVNIPKHRQAESESLSGKGWEESTAEGKVQAGLAEQDSLGSRSVQTGSSCTQGWLQRNAQVSQEKTQQHRYLSLHTWILLSDSPPKEQGLQATCRA